MQKYSSDDFLKAAVAIMDLEKFMQQEMTEESSRDISVIKSSLRRSALIAQVSNGHIEGLLSKIALKERINNVFSQSEMETLRVILTTILV